MKTIVLGASPKPERYAYEAVVRLLSKGHEVIPIGIRQGKTAGDLDIINGMPLIENVHTVTLYISSDIQAEYYDYILNTIHPKRIIFNPGTENPELLKLIKERGLKIEVEVACTLVMLNLGLY
jgi:predicted CoA-binding protein